MRLIALILAAVFAASCATPVEHVRYMGGLPVAQIGDELPAAATPVPYFDGAVKNGIVTMPEIKLFSAATAQITTTKLAPFTALDSTQQNAKIVQDVVVTNYDPTGSVCLYLEATTDTCASTTAFTCLGASLQGMTTPPGNAREFVIVGSKQICAVASATLSVVQMERSLYFAR